MVLAVVIEKSAKYSYLFSFSLLSSTGDQLDWRSPMIAPSMAERTTSVQPPMCIVHLVSVKQRSSSSILSGTETHELGQNRESSVCLYNAQHSTNTDVCEQLGASTSQHHSHAELSPSGMEILISGISSEGYQT
jgi:hypothetical protein